MKWREQVDLMANTTEEELNLIKKLAIHHTSIKEVPGSDYEPSMSMLVQTNTMIIIFRCNEESYTITPNNIEFIAAAIKTYLIKILNISKVHIILPDMPYDKILSFLTTIVPLIYRYTKRKITVHHYNLYKHISKRAPSVLNALPLYIKKRIIVNGSKWVTIGHLDFNLIEGYVKMRR